MTRQSPSMTVSRSAIPDPKGLAIRADEECDALYCLRVRFRSNEHPWSGTYTPLPAHQPVNDIEAQRWAERMSDGLGNDYDCTLMRGDTMIAWRASFPPRT